MVGTTAQKEFSVVVEQLNYSACFYLSPIKNLKDK